MYTYKTSLYVQYRIHILKISMLPKKPKMMVVDEELQNPMLKGNLLPTNQLIRFK